MKYFHLFILSLCSLFVVGCQAFEEESDAPSKENNNYTVRFPLDIQGTSLLRQTPTRASDPIEVPGSPEENAINNVVVAGVAQSTYNASGHYLEIPSSNLSRSFYFAANLTSADQNRVKNSTSPETLELNTLDYLGADGKLKAGSYIPLVGNIDQVKYSEFTSPGGAVQNLLIYNSEVKLMRAFAKVDLAIEPLAGITITKIEVINVPKKFALGSTIADYDTKDVSNYGYTSFNVQMEAGASAGKYKASFYLPEHTVINPVKLDPDTHNMTCLIVTYRDGSNIEYKEYRRLALFSDTDGDFAIGKEGKIVRNFIFFRGISPLPKVQNPYGDAF